MKDEGRCVASSDRSVHSSSSTTVTKNCTVSPLNASICGYSNSLDSCTPLLSASAISRWMRVQIPTCGVSGLLFTPNFSASW